jgi:hypothetical protein
MDQYIVSISLVGTLATMMTVLIIMVTHSDNKLTAAMKENRDAREASAKENREALAINSEKFAAALQRMDDKFIAAMREFRTEIKESKDR